MQQFSLNDDNIIPVDNKTFKCKTKEKLTLTTVMKLILALSVSMFVLCVNTANLIDSHLNEEWSEFKTKFNRTYSASEELKRFEVFRANAEKIKAHNERYDMGLESFKIGMNRYGDLTYDEVVKIHTPNKTDE